MYTGDDERVVDGVDVVGGVDRIGQHDRLLLAVDVGDMLRRIPQRSCSSTVQRQRRTTHNHDFSPVEIPENGGGRRAIDRTSWRFWLSLAVYTILRPPEHAIGG